MSTKRSIKPDQYTIIMFIVIAILFGTVGFTVKGILDAFNTARAIDEKLLESSDVRILEPELNKALKVGLKREFVPLDLPE